MNHLLRKFLSHFGIKVKPPRQFDKLEIGLTKTISLVQKLETENISYLVSIIKNKDVILQIMHGALMIQTNTEKNIFNYSINLTFDGEEEKKKKFEKLIISKDFKFYEYDSCPCFAINLAKDEERLKILVARIMEEVYGFDRTTVFEYDIESYGPAHLAIPS